MYYDALTMACVRDELVGLLLDGRVQRVVQPDELSLGMEVFAGRRYDLLLSANAQQAGVLLADTKLRRGVDAPSTMLLLMRKFVRGARLAALEQDPLERVLRIMLQGPEGTVSLICEVMGRLSNIILVDERGVVMDAIKRVPLSINRVRVTLPHQPYEPPPPQDKLSALEITPADMDRILGEGDGLAWRQLLGRVSGISPLLAREIVHRGAGSASAELPLDTSARQRTLIALDELVHLPQTQAWQPCVAREQDRPRAWAGYDLTHMKERSRVESISGAIWQVWGARASYDAYGQARAQLHEILDEQIDRQNARLASLGRSNVSEEDIELAQIKGNAILTMGWSLEPGQTSLTVNPVELGLAEPGQAPEDLTIRMDPSLSPSESAQKLFERYRKLRAAADQVPELMEESRRELAYLAQLGVEVDLAQDRAQLDEIRDAMGKAGYLAKRRKRRNAHAASAPIRLRTENDALILVGRNSRQNHELTFKRAAPSDMWLHAHNVPGSHVIIKPGIGGHITDDDLHAAAELAAYYSGSRGSARVQVDYCERRHVRPIRKGRPGMVTYRNEETLVVAPRPAKEV